MPVPIAVTAAAPRGAGHEENGAAWDPPTGERGRVERAASRGKPCGKCLGEVWGRCRGRGAPVQELLEPEVDFEEPLEPESELFDPELDEPEPDELELEEPELPFDSELLDSDDEPESLPERDPFDLRLSVL